jgi:hypothetical protein
VSYAIELYRGEFAPQIAELQKHLWGPSATENSAYLEWKYARNPYTEQPLLYVALDGSRVVGMRGMYGSRWEVGSDGETVDIPCAADSVIEPGHRDAGLFKGLNDFAAADLRERGYDLALNLSASAANYLASILTLGWRSVGGLQPLSRGTSQSRILAPLLSWGGRHRVTRTMIGQASRARDAVQSNAFSRLDRAASGSLREPLTIAIEPRPAEMQNLVRRLARDSRLRHLRDRTYFSWRFANPRSTYRFLYWGEPIEGYLVLENPKREARVFIVDWDGTSPDVCASLLDAAVQLGRFGALETWNATLRPEASEVLRRAGFRAARAPRHSNMFLLRSMNEDRKKPIELLPDHDPLKMDSWDLRMICSDVH